VRSRLNAVLSFEEQEIFMNTRNKLMISSALFLLATGTVTAQMQDDTFATQRPNESTEMPTTTVDRVAADTRSYSQPRDGRIQRFMHRMHVPPIIDKGTPDWINEPGDYYVKKGSLD
jgi:hypothetical protein